MDEDRNADIVREAFIAISRGDEDAFVALLDDNVEGRSSTRTRAGEHMARA